MKFDEQVEFLFHAWLDDTKQTVCTLGPPGIGKTAVGRDLADRMTSFVTDVDATHGEAVCAVVDLSSCLPEDLMGLPFREGEITKYCPAEWLYEVCNSKAYGILILDDLPAASRDVQVAARQISLERRVHSHKVSDRILILVTGNRREDKSAASTLPAHFRNSVLMLELQPDLEMWMKWYATQEFDPLIPAYLQWRVGNFSKLPKDADKNGSFATPRTWAMLGKMCPVAKKQSVLFDVAAGLVGEGVATELVAFDKMKNALVSPAKVLENPRKNLPDISTISGSPDKMVAMVTGIADLSAQRGKAKAHVTAFLSALAYITQQDNEYVAVGINTYRAKGGSANALVREVGELRKSNPDVASMVEVLKGALS